MGVFLEFDPHNVSTKSSHQLGEKFANGTRVLGDQARDDARQKTPPQIYQIKSI